MQPLEQLNSEEQDIVKVPQADVHTIRRNHVVAVLASPSVHCDVLVRACCVKYNWTASYTDQMSRCLDWYNVCKRENLHKEIEGHVWECKENATDHSIGVYVHAPSFTPDSAGLA